MMKDKKVINENHLALLITNFKKNNANSLEMER